MNRAAILSLLLLILVVTVVALSANPFSVFSTWITGSLSLLCLALAAGIVLSSGEVDIATGAILSLVGTSLVSFSGGIDASVPGVLFAHFFLGVFALSVYFLMSFLVNYGLSSIIVTLAVMFICRGLSVLLQSCRESVGQLCRDTNLNEYLSGSGALSPEFVISDMNSLSFSLALVLTLVGVLYVWRHRTRWGLEHIAVGMNHNSSEFANIDISKIRFRSFLMAGCLVFLGTIIRLHGVSNGGWSANVGWGEELVAIAIAVIGGTRITGGRFEPIGIALACVFVYSLRDVVANDLKLPSELASIVFGLVLLAAVAWDASTELRLKNVDKNA